MPMPARKSPWGTPDKTVPDSSVRLLIGGLEHSDWEDYDVDSDLLTPADAWHVKLALKDGDLPASVATGASVEIRVGDDPVMVGRIDSIEDEVSKNGLHIGISGRDGAAVLLDCSAPIFVARMASLDEIIIKVVRALGITKYRIDAASTRVREKINVEPGDSAWEVLTNAAEANGLWPWFEPDGTLVVGGPDYDKPPVATLILRRSGKGNNVLSLRRRNSIQGRFSEVTVLGQCHGTKTETGKNAIKSTQKDKGVSWYRPKIIIDHESDSVAVADDRARKLLSDSRLKGFSLFAEVEGHRIVAPGQAADGLLWTPGQRVHVISERHQIDDVFFLMARKFTGGRHQGPRTHLTLKEDKTWVLDAHPHKNKHRLGKNSAPAQILDVSKGAAQ